MFERAGFADDGREGELPARLGDEAVAVFVLGDAGAGAGEAHVHLGGEFLAAAVGAAVDLGDEGGGGGGLEEAADGEELGEGGLGWLLLLLLLAA